MTRISIGRDTAIELAETHWWELCTEREAAEFQMAVDELCMPFSEFHRCLEAALGRPVWTHELALNYDGIAAELLGERSAPTFDEIVALIPESKRIVLVAKK